MLFVERSNRTEALFEGLAERLTAPGRDPLARAVVVVQGAGMERWIAQQVARRSGVCANVEFPFPRPFLESLFEAMPGSRGEEAPRVWDLDRMTFAIARTIAQAGEAPATDEGAAVYAPLLRHLAGADRDARLVSLARQIANVFDQYITYRPDWTRAWEREGEGPAAIAEESSLAWQIRLFRTLREQLGPGHIADRAAAFCAAVSGPGRRALEANLRRRFPDAIEIFAVATLPPLHLEVVRALAAVVDVRLSVLTPSRAWYSDLWRELRDPDAVPPGAIGSLLVGLGRLGADFQQTLEDGLSPDGGDRELFVAPARAGGDASLLVRLQARLLDLEEGAEAGPAGEVAPEDDSIRVHLCHGPRRELEVVENVLRAAFEGDPTLAPEDVIVMAPDIDAIAADIDAVFGPGADEGDGIPYRIADRGTYRRSPVADAFRGLLGLVGTRMSRSAVFDWLALPDVAARFSLDEAGVLALADWAERAGHRFGLDEAQRAALGLPALRGHTLAGSLDRLVLAHALGETQDVVRGLSPVGLDAFADPAWIGAIAEVDALLAFAVDGSRSARSVGEWAGWLEGLLGRSVAKRDENSHEHGAIVALLHRLRTAAEAVGFTRAIAFEAMRDRIVSALAESPSPQAFLAGGVTFCQLVPLRAIPFRVVVITGLVDGDFPRSRAAVGFDLMAKHARAGDRTVRDDDRHLFLEALLSAREKLVLTVPARDLQNGQARPVSIVVSELLDALNASFVPAADDPLRLRDALVVSHPLQATSPCYFQRDRDPRLVSRSERAHRGAVARREALAARAWTPRTFLTPGGTGLVALRAEAMAAESGGPVLSLDVLVDRILRSTRHFAREVLALRLPRPEAVQGDLDPFALTPLEKAGLGRALFADLAAGIPFEQALERMRASPLLPAGLPGEILMRGVRSEAQTIARIAAARRVGAPLPDLDFELVLPARGAGAPARLVGRIDRLWSDARIEAEFGRLGGDRDSALWIRHLVLCALADAGHPLPRESVGIGRPPKDGKSEKERLAVVVFAPVSSPLEQLALLFDWAWRVPDAPLPFFERASRAFAEKCASEKEGALAAAWRAARAEFEGRDDSGRRKAEGEQALETVRIWEGHSPIAPAGENGVALGFDELARGFFEPLFEARRRLAE